MSEVHRQGTDSGMLWLEAVKTSKGVPLRRLEIPQPMTALEVTAKISRPPAFVP